MFSRLNSLALSIVGLLLVTACAGDTITEPLQQDGFDLELLAPPSGNAVELLIQISSPTQTSGNPPNFSLASLPASVAANTTWSRTITIEPNHPFAPQVAVDYGDGGGPKAVSVHMPQPTLIFNPGTGEFDVEPAEGPSTFHLSHRYTSPGTYTVRVAAQTGEGGGTRIVSRSITVTPDLNLYIRNFEISSPVKAGWPAEFSFEAEGPGGPDELYTMTIALGDGLTTHGFIPPGGSRTRTHTWKEAGTYTLSVTISNGTTAATVNRQVTVESSPVSIEEYFLTPQVDEGEPVQYRFRVMGPGSGPYAITITAGGLAPIVRTAAPGALLTGTLELESGLHQVVVEVTNGESNASASKLTKVSRPPPSIVGLQVPETAYVGEEALVTFLAVDATENAEWKAWAVAWKRLGAPDGDWVGTPLQETFEAPELSVEAPLTFDAPGDHEVWVLVGSRKNSVEMTDTIVSVVHVEERPDVTCEPGSYKVNYECVAAPAGSYVPDAGAEEATICPVGTYQGLTGQTSCLSAPIGSYVDVMGAAEATACPALTSTMSTGSTSEADCLLVGTVAVNRIDEAVSNGGLVPAQAGRGGQNQFDNWVSGVKRAVQFLEGPQRQAGCVQLRNGLAQLDAASGPRAVVTGPARVQITADLRWVMEEYGC